MRAMFWLSCRWVFKRRALLLRGGLCWLVGIVLLFLGGGEPYDLRFNLRAPQEVAPEVALILMSQDEWIRLHGQRRSVTRPLKEITHLTDSFYWNELTWIRILNHVLRDNPSAVGVTFYFGDNISRPKSYVLSTPELNDPRVIWSANYDSEGRPLVPLFASSYGQNAGMTDFHTDNDSTVRRFASPLAYIPHMALRLAKSIKPQVLSDRLTSGTSQTINFQGPAGTFKRYSLSDLLDDRLPPGTFTGKVVIIGSRDSESHLYRTPVGEMTRAELLANVVDNVAMTKWIRPIPWLWSAFGLFLLLLLCTWIINTYPSAVALVFFFWIGIAWVAISLWTFDEHYIWTPIFSALGQMGATYVVFIAYQISVKDNLNWRLEQERKYLLEVEQLKNNFVSLISHDLKTPIAKIQAICDRVMSQHPQNELAEDLHLLRRESSELHRYIQSILHITRVESRDFKLRKDAADINEMASRVTSQLQPLAHAKNIELTLELEPMFLVELDSILVSEVILNLIENAIKYTPNGGQIVVRTRELDNRVFLEVADNGPGISAENQKRVFEKFFRVGAENSQIKGSGLGLYLVKYFIELHGGEVFLNSQVGQGTQIGFSLPVAEESANPTQEGDMEWRTN